MRDARQRRTARAAAQESATEAADFMRARAQWRALTPDARRRAVARRRAARLGLAYWPALLIQCTVDPRCFVITESIAESLGLGRWDPPHSWGGWDAAGYHGVSPATVARLWRAAGCRNTTKFRTAVRACLLGAWPDICRGDSLPWTRDYVRGLLWLSRRERGLQSVLSRKAIAALGRLSPQFRLAAILPFLGDAVLPRRLRIRDLDWAGVRRAQRDAANSPVARAALLTPGALGLSPPEYRALLQSRLPPAWAAAELPLWTLRAIALGRSPQVLAGAPFTRSEAAEWLLAGMPSRLDWLCGHREIPFSRSIQVIEWLTRLRQAGRIGQLETTRTPTGVPLLHCLDEVAVGDLPTGRETPRQLLDALLARGVTGGSRTPWRLIGPAIDLGRLPRWFRVLRSPSALKAEGAAMRHCVGRYADKVAYRETIIIAIRSLGGRRRSTLELSPDGQYVRQHLGRANVQPPIRHVALVTAWLNRRRAPA